MIKLEDLEPGSGQRHAKIALQKNGNPPPEFIPNSFLVTPISASSSEASKHENDRIL